MNNEIKKILTTTMENEYDQQIIIMQYIEPTDQVTKIYTALKYKPKPFKRKKQVVPLPEIKKTKTPPEQTYFLIHCNVV